MFWLLLYLGRYIRVMSSSGDKKLPIPIATRRQAPAPHLHISPHPSHHPTPRKTTFAGSKQASRKLGARAPVQVCLFCILRAVPSFLPSKPRLQPNKKICLSTILFMQHLFMQHLFMQKNRKNVDQGIYAQRSKAKARRQRWSS